MISDVGRGLIGWFILVSFGFSWMIHFKVSILINAFLIDKDGNNDEEMYLKVLFKKIHVKNTVISKWDYPCV